MKFLQELVTFKRIDTEEYPDEFELDGELPPDDEFVDDSVDGPIADELVDDPMEGDVVDSEETPDEDVEGNGELGEEPSEPEDPNKQGLIRTVKGAHLVYKREVEDGTYEELWQYNTSNLRDEITIRKAILAGTDIPVNRAHSPDGSQSFEMWAAGNAELMLIRGLQQ